MLVVDMSSVLRHPHVLAPSLSLANADLAESTPTPNPLASLFQPSPLNHSPSSHIKHLTMLVSLTVGKVDAGVAVLLTQDNRLVSTRCPWSHGNPPKSMPTT
jgi:hypothetical protein